MIVNRKFIILWSLICISLVIGVLANPAYTSASDEPTRAGLLKSYALDDRPFTFAVFGDNRPDSIGKGQPAIFKEILKQVDTLSPAFAVNTGDCIYGAPTLKQIQQQYKEYKDTVSSLLRTKVYLAIGNHEVRESKLCQDFFQKELGSLYYSFDFGNSHFIVLDSEVIGQAHRITGEQLEWLKQDLFKSRAARHKFVFLHQPLYPVDGHMGRCLDKYPEERDALHRLFVRNRVTAVFAGHEHLFHSERRNGVWYIITGGAGAPLYPSYKLEGDFHHYVIVSIDGDKLTVKAIRLGEDGKPDEVIYVVRENETPQLSTAGFFSRLISLNTPMCLP